MQTARLIIAMAIAALWPAGPAYAHPAPFTYVDLKLQPSAIEVGLVAHVFDVAHDLKIEPSEQLLEPARVAAESSRIIELLAPRLQVLGDGERLGAIQWSGVESAPDRQAVMLRGRVPLSRTPGRVSMVASLFPYDPQHQTFVNVYEGDTLVSQAILDTGRHEMEHFTGTRQGTLAVVQRFLPSGIHHILIGPDHLLFLVGLLLLGGTTRQLLLLVTAFTVAHSITLSLAALDILSPPARLIEPAIALSIVYVGADNLMVRGGRDMRVWIAFVFGFIHGFGFANVLREMALPARALGWSLFSFNLGVEVGQVAVVVVVATLLAAIRARSEVAGRRLAIAGSVFVIAAGAFWFVERVFFSGGMA